MLFYGGYYGGAVRVGYKAQVFRLHLKPFRSQLYLPSAFLSGYVQHIALPSQIIAYLQEQGGFSYAGVAA